LRAYPQPWCRTRGSTATFVGPRLDDLGMHEPFTGVEALRAGQLTRGQLRWRHTSIQPRVHLPRGTQQSLHVNTLTAWLWTGRTGVVAGRAAAALHGAKWVDASTPVEIIAEHTRRRDGYNQAFIDIGYDEPKVGLDYEGVHHSENRGQYVHDIGRTELIEGEGWIDLRVVKEHGRRFTLHRVRSAFKKRGWKSREEDASPPVRSPASAPSAPPRRPSWPRSRSG
jgi:hypothetical protein